MLSRSTRIKKRHEKYQEKAEQERKRNMEATNKARGVADQEEQKKAVALAGHAQPCQINLEKQNPMNEYPEVIKLSQLQNHKYQRMA